eukprot:TRINITY_DN11142_c0_g1_i1.p1 TRINITY_DN11142_c0_g1~~TRINITY_DN11142_c0_g1_i1.p1  ORF type:complete len:422 (-),score=90.90 TRINITY_DN11142_c0_g1_i1:30-1295(-)
MFKLTCLILVLAFICVSSLNAADDKTFPDLPTEFESPVLMDIPFFGKQKGRLYYSLTQSAYRLDVSAFGALVSDLYLFDLETPAKYQITQQQCQFVETLDPDTFWYMAIPPFAEHVGQWNIHDKICQQYDASLFGLLDVQYFVSNETVQDKVEYTLEQFNVNVAGFSTEMEFLDVVPGPQDPDLFDLAKLGCPPPRPPVSYVVEGYVKSATTNRAVEEGVKVELSTGISTTTDKDGHYKFSGLSESNITFTVSGNGYYTTEKTLVVNKNIINGVANFIISPKMPRGNFRAVLTWDQYPLDLDSYATDPNDCTVYYRHKKCVNPNNSSAYVFLDVDATKGYGPETTTFVGFDGTTGTYKFLVRQYSSGGDLRKSNAVVKFYNADSLVSTVEIPNSGPGGKTWLVADIIPPTGSVNVINKITN